jgi:cation diffusion facilitator CzcD-associated flavoprotein CzcO
MADVLIVGAGPAGLAVGAVLKQAGVFAIILEQANCVASKWHAHYERLHLHTARRHSGLPYLPMPDDYPTYPSRTQVIAYLDNYAKHFQLDIRFRQRVTAVDFDGKIWTVTTPDSSYSAPNLVIATGLNEQPIMPIWPGQHTFAGRIIHSSDYKSGEAFRGQDVLVIGFGNSGGEIAIDLCEHGARPGLSVRGPVNVVFRDLFGIPTQRIAMFLRRFPPWFADMVTATSIRRAYGDLHRYGLKKPDYGPATQIRKYRRIPVIDVGTIKLIREGKIKVYPGVREFAPPGVIFSDGTAKPFHSVVLATGYTTSLSTLFKDASKLVDSTGFPLVSGGVTVLPGLYFCGLHNAAAGLLREIGIEAQRIGQLIAEKSQAAQAS